MNVEIKTLEQAKVRVSKLRELINDYRYHYHVLDVSIMSEPAADALKHELSELEAKYPDLITKDSPTQRVAGEVSPAFKSEAHSKRMLSLNDVFNEVELQAWLTRVAKYLDTPADSIELFADLKLDGLACALRYEDGKLITGITRGDGLNGEDVTANIRTIESIPLILNSHVPGITEVRGEITMHKSDFDELNISREKQGLPLFMNPRNTAAGTIRQLDPRLVADRKLYFYTYDIASYHQEIKTNLEVYKTLSNLGFRVNKMASKFSSVTSLKQFIDDWDTKRTSLPFNTDGVVVKLNDRGLYVRAGVVGKAPRGAAAFKYPAEQSTTKVRDIFISIGRTGAATPVAILEPVLIAGSTVQMATLHNESEIARKDIRVGDTVIVQKAGDIIPEIVRPLTELRDGNQKKFVMSKVCPECGQDLKRQQKSGGRRLKLSGVQGENEQRSEAYTVYDERVAEISTRQSANSLDGVSGTSRKQGKAIEPVWEAVWRCMNTKCPARVSNLIQHFASKGALDIEGLGEKNVVALLDAGLIQTTADLYSLEKSQVLVLERFAEKSADNLIDAIAAKKTPPLHKFIFALGIRHVGVQTAVDLANKFKNLDNLGVAAYQELIDVDGVGEVVAESIIAWFAEPDNTELLAKFRRLSVWPESVKVSHLAGKLASKKLAVTGSLDGMSREEAAEKIREAGGTFQSSVGKDTDYLVAGANVGASKLDKARKLGIKVISQDDLRKLL